MKKIYGFSALAIAMAFASCSSDDLVGNGPADLNNSEKTARINVQLRTSVSGTRADNTNNTDEDFKYGTATENQINSVLLGFYNEGGTLLELATVPVVSTAPDNVDPTNVALTATCSVPVEDNTATSATKLVAYVNISASEVLNKTLAEVGTATLSNVEGTNGFPMTTSGYYKDGTTYVNYNTISSADFYKVGTVNENAPVQIYVERVAAKIQLDKISEVSEYTVYDKNGNELELTFTPNAWAVQATAQSSYLLKSMESIATIADWMKVGSNNYRNYWAASVDYSKTFIGLPAGDATVDADITPTLAYVKYGDISTNTFEGTSTYTSTATVYTNENTFPASRLNSESLTYNPWTAATSIVLAGTYTVSETGEENKFADGFYLRASTRLDETGEKLVQVQSILTEAEAIDVMVNAASYITKNGTSLTANDVELVYLAGSDNMNPANSRYIQLKSAEGEATYAINGVTADAAAVNAELAKMTPAKYYNGGKAFFYIPLKHYVAGESASTAQYLPFAEIVEGNYGIVRNNWYVLTINKITGLGTGIGSDDDIPVPDPEEDAYAIDAVLNVLQWHMRNQSVDL